MTNKKLSKNKGKKYLILEPSFEIPKIIGSKVFVGCRLYKKEVGPGVGEFIYEEEFPKKISPNLKRKMRLHARENAEKHVQKMGWKIKIEEEKYDTNFGFCWNLDKQIQ